MIKAMILAAGRGERMRPLTNDTPKPLLEAAGKPLIVRLIEQLAAVGIRELVINVSHFGERIERRLGSGAHWAVSIAYSREHEPLETAGGIATALPLLGAAPFLVVNGDIHTDFDFARLTEAPPVRGESVAHLVLIDNPAHHPRGDFALNGKRVANEGAVRYTFSGIGVYSPALFAPVAAGTKYQLANLLRPQIDAERVTGEHFDGRWTDVGTPERLRALDRELTWT